MNQASNYSEEKVIRFELVKIYEYGLILSGDVKEEKYCLTFWVGGKQA